MCGSVWVSWRQSVLVLLQLLRSFNKTHRKTHPSTAAKRRFWVTTISKCGTAHNKAQLSINISLIQSVTLMRAWKRTAKIRKGFSFTSAMKSPERKDTERQTVKVMLLRFFRRIRWHRADTHSNYLCSSTLECNKCLWFLIPKTKHHSNSYFLLLALGQVKTTLFHFSRDCLITTTKK